MEDEYLSRCVVDTIQRKVHLYSDEGDTKTVECETVDRLQSLQQHLDKLTISNVIDS